MVGVSVSGGGSRAALFAAGALEALGRLRVEQGQHSLLERVSYISSVSGGSLASAYYVLKKPGRDVPLLTERGELSSDYQSFFTGFKEAMANDYEGPLLWRNLLRWRWMNPAFAAKSLAEILVEDYLGPETFKQLSERESRLDVPRLMINTTLYNDGRRLLLSTLPGNANQFDLVKELRRIHGKDDVHPDDWALLDRRWGGLLSVNPQDLHIDVCRVRVAISVAASMSFPPIIGPISLKDEERQRFWHIGDGGMSDNTGAESLLMVALKSLQQGTIRRALIVMIDSSFPFEVGGEALDHRADGFSIFSYDFSRIPSIMEERSLAYRSLFVAGAQQLGLIPPPESLRFIRLRHTDAQWHDNLDDLPESCKKEKVNWKSPKDVGRHLAGVVTRLWLESSCDRDLVLAAAAKVVSQNEGRIKEFLQASPP